jgi:hypothetical protein
MLHRTTVGPAHIVTEEALDCCRVLLCSFPGDSKVLVFFLATVTGGGGGSQEDARLEGLVRCATVVCRTKAVMSGLSA